MIEEFFTKLIHFAW